MIFKKGDRVVAIKPVAELTTVEGKFGTVLKNCYEGHRVAVEFDEIFELGHSCSGLGKPGRCRYGEPDEFMLVSEVFCEDDMVVSDEDSKLLDDFLSGFKL